MGTTRLTWIRCANDRLKYSLAAKAWTCGRSGALRDDAKGSREVNEATLEPKLPEGCCRKEKTRPRKPRPGSRSGTDYLFCLSFCPDANKRPPLLSWKCRQVNALSR